MSRPLLVSLLFATCLPIPTRSEEAPVIAVTDGDALAAREGEEVLVEGRVSSTRINTAGIHFLEFDGTPFVCVTFAQNLGAFPGGPPSEIYRDQWVRVRGTVEKFRGSPQIKLLSPDQIQIVEAPVMAASPSPDPTPADAAPETPAPVPAQPAADGGAEVVDGIPALDWRKYFPGKRE